MNRVPVFAVILVVGLSCQARALSFDVTYLGLDNDYHSINNAGQVAGSLGRVTPASLAPSVSPPVARPVAVIREPDGTMTAVTEPAGSLASSARQITDGGLVLVEWDGPPGGVGCYIWNSHTGSIVHVDKGAWEINESCQSIGQNTAGNPCFWEADGTPVVISTTSPWIAWAQSLTNDGTVLVSKSTGDGVFLWRSGQTTPIPKPAGASIYDGIDLNERGQVLGLFAGTGGERGFLWDPGGSTEIIEFPEGIIDLQLVSVNGLGHFCGSYLDSDYNSRVFFWSRETGVMDISIDGHPNQAIMINDRDQILGKWGEEYLIWSPVPEPCSTAALLLGIAGLAAHSRRRAI